MPMPPGFDEIAKKVSNWGRWGDDDQLGTLNLITPEAVRRAAACVRTGKRFPLALPLSTDGPQTGAVPGRVNPVRTMISINAPIAGDPAGPCMSDDVVFMGLQAATHWDSLAHVSFNGTLYNGVPSSAVTAWGARLLGIDRVGALTGRGVLLDVARAKGLDRVEPGYAITREDLDAAEELAKVRVGEGDIALIRTGHMTWLKDKRKKSYAAPSPGPSMETVTWFHERGLAAVATDTMTFEVFLDEPAYFLLPVHVLDIVEMGLTQGQNFDLEALAADCADDGVYAFLLEASPLPFAGGVGSPVAPVAVK